jgi:hypothetical protein
MKTANELLYKLKKTDMGGDYKNNYLSSAPKRKAADSSELFVPINQTIQHHIQEDCNLDTYKFCAR